MRRQAFLGLLLSFFLGCGGGGSKSPTTPTPSTPAQPTVSSLALTGTASLTAVGQTSQLTATATLSNGATQNVTNTAAWQSSNAGVATVSSTGLLTAGSAGTATITATYQGQSAALGVTVSTTPPSTGGSPAGGTFAGPINDARWGVGTLRLVLNKTIPNGYNYTGTWQLTLAGNTHSGTLVAAASFMGASLFSLNIIYTASSINDADCGGSMAMEIGAYFTQNSISDNAYYLDWRSACASAFKLPVSGTLSLSRQ